MARPQLKLALPRSQEDRDELLLAIYQVLTGNGDPSTVVLGRLDCIERKIKTQKRLWLGITTGLVVTAVSSLLA